MLECYSLANDDGRDLTTLLSDHGNRFIDNPGANWGGIQHDPMRPTSQAYRC
jgi:hypothetical protein